MDFQRKGFKFISKGIQLTRPVDALEEGKYVRLENVRSYTDGTIHPRLGMTAPTGVLGTGPAHSIKRFFDSTSATAAEIVGSGTKLYFNNVEVATGFSGKPLSFVPIRPFSSIENWVYIGDVNKTVKVNKTGVVRQVGLTPPLLAATVALGGPTQTVLDNFETAPNGWANGGTAGAITLVAAKRVDTTITYILYDTGSTGWACVVPAALDNGIQPGLLMEVAAAEEVRITNVFTAIADTTIGSIKYDTGTTGACTIQLTSPSLEGLSRDAIVRIAAAENVRVLSVTTGPDGLPSFRCVTTGTRSAGDAVAGLKSFRAFFTGTRAATNTLKSEAFSTTVTVGVGYLDKVAAFNLATVSSRPIQSTDLIHISIRLDVPGNLTEGKILFNLDTGSTAFDKNYFYYPFSANSLIPATTNTLTTQSVQQTIIQRQQIDQSILQLQQRYHPGVPTSISNKLPYMFEGDGEIIPQIDDPSTLLPQTDIPTTGTTQTTTGTSQWTELVFKVSDLIRVGSDTSKGLANVNALRIQFNVTATTVCDIDSFWIGGTYGLDSSSSFPYIWTYRYRSQATGAISNPAPPLRSGLEVTRGRAVLTPTVSSDAQVDLIDYFRYGGTLPEWHYVGTTPNSGTFTDTYPDEAVNGNFGLDEDNFQPFPIADAPRTGTCDVVGTEVTRVSGDTFNTSWARGSEIVINGTPTSLYTSPTSTSRLSLEDNLGTLTGVTFLLPSPTLLGQPLPAIWGPYSVGGVNYFFGCKDGTVFYTKGNNPDSAPEENQLEVTSPEEPLIGGCVYDGQGYLFSTERMFRLLPTGQPGALFEAQEIPVGKGLMAPWSLCVDELVYFVSRDGLYETNGTEVKNITDKDLYPLFPHDGQAGIIVGNLNPPDFTHPESLRLAAGDGLVKFTYRETGLTAFRTWVYDTRVKGFTSLDLHFDDFPGAVVCHYWDEGGSGSYSTTTRERGGTYAGRVYTLNSGTTDGGGSSISSIVQTASFDAGDTRAKKIFGDAIFDHSGTILVTAGADNFTQALGFTTLVQAVRDQSIFDWASGIAPKVRNLGFTIEFLDPTAVLYEWQPSFVPRPEDTKLRWMDFDDDGSPEAKWFQGLVLEADTNGQDRTVQVQGDGGIVVGTLTVNHNGLAVKDYPQGSDTWMPQVTHMMRLVPSDPNEWEIFKVKWIYEPSPPASTKWQSQGTSHGFEDFHHLRRVWVAVQNDSPVTMTLNADGVDYSYTIPSVGGLYHKVMVPVQAIKAKLWRYTFTSSSAFRLFLNDSIVEAQGWGLSGPYKNIQPFGAVHHYQTQARI